MTLGERVEERRKAAGIASQAALARAAGLPQSTLNGLINRPYRWSPHLSRIAGALSTTVAYLVGETDDPDQNAPPPPPAPRVQLVTLQVALPSEAALAAMFEAQLQVFGDLQGAELARALAKRLPNGLVRLREARSIEQSDAHHDQAAGGEPPPGDRHEVQRAQRT